MFDASNLVQAVMDQQMAEVRPLVPKGEYIATSLEVKPEMFRIITSEKMKPGENGCDRTGKRLILGLPWEIDSAQYPSVMEATRRSKNTVRQDIFVDVTPDSEFDAGRFTIAGGLEANLQLGRLRKIFGQNENGKPWSFSMLGGKTARVTVDHRKDGENEYDGVVKVVAL